MQFSMRTVCIAARTIQQTTCVQRATVKKLKSAENMHIEVCMCFLSSYSSSLFFLYKKMLQKFVRKVLGNDIWEKKKALIWWINLLNSSRLLSLPASTSFSAHHLHKGLHNPISVLSDSKCPRTTAWQLGKDASFQQKYKRKLYLERDYLC